jgi:hypothetical protein
MKIIKINLWNQGIRWSNTGNKIAATCNKIWFIRMLIANVYTYITNHEATCVNIST